MSIELTVETENLAVILQCCLPLFVCITLILSRSPLALFAARVCEPAAPPDIYSARQVAMPPHLAPPHLCPTTFVCETCRHRSYLNIMWSNFHCKPMSCFLTTTFLGLAQGHHKAMVKLNQRGKETRVHHTHYTTSLQCVDGTAAPTLLYVYSTSSDVLLPNNTVAFVIAKTWIPLHNIAILDALYLTKVPGDPNSEMYKDNVPDIPIPFVQGVGQVTGCTNVLPGTKINCFPVNVSEYVQDEQRIGTIMSVAFSSGVSIDLDDSSASANHVIVLICLDVTPHS